MDMESESSSSNECKRVSFAAGSDSVVVFIAGDAMAPLWLDSEEYREFREQVKEEADGLKLKGYGILLRNCFDETDKHVQRHMDVFAQLPDSDYARGTEAHLSRQHRDERDQIHTKVTKAVLSRQRALRANDTPVEAVPEKLRSASRKHSRSSRVFARRLGIADERAIQLGDNLVHAQTIVKELNQGNARMARRKQSTQELCGLNSSGGKSTGGVTQMFGLAYMTSQRNHTSKTTEKVDRIPVRVLSTADRSSSGATTCTAAATANCADVIQNALDLLDLGDGLDDPFTQLNQCREVAKSA